MINIYHLISSKIRVALLRIMALNPESSFNINELSRLTGFSLRGVDKELKNLLSGGMLRRDISGNQHRFRLDPACPIRQELKGIITKTVGVSEILKKGLSQIRDVIHLAFVYGSFASGDYRNQSDIDLFATTERTSRNVAGIQSSGAELSAHRSTGCLLSGLEPVAAGRSYLIKFHGKKQFVTFVNNVP